MSTLAKFNPWCLVEDWLTVLMITQFRPGLHHFLLDLRITDVRMIFRTRLEEEHKDVMGPVRIPLMKKDEIFKETCIGQVITTYHQNQLLVKVIEDMKMRTDTVIKKIVNIHQERTITLHHHILLLTRFQVHPTPQINQTAIQNTIVWKYRAETWVLVPFRK